jgi:ketosteroid isomerase-like protein
MTADDEQVVRRAVDAWNRQDVEALRALSHPDVEFVNSPTAVEPGTRSGVEATATAMDRQWEILQDARHELDAFYERGDEIITLGRIARQMPDSDTRIEEPVMIAWTVRDGKFRRITVLGFGRTEVAAARKAADLPA